MNIFLLDMIYRRIRR